MDQGNQNQIHQMNIKNLSDTQLLEHLQRLFNYEKKLNQALLLAIMELNHRKIFLEMGYSSLFDMLVRHFRLSESSAYQKISTMKLMKSVPKTQEFIQNGDLSLTNAAMAQSFITKVEKNEEKKMTVLEKQNIISAICHKTQKEAQAILADIHPVVLLPISVEKQITTNHTQIQILINQETNQKIQELKSLYSHQIPDGDLNQLFSLIIDFAFDKHPMNRNKNSKTKQSADNNSTKYQSTQQDDQANSDSIHLQLNQNLPLVQSIECQISDQYNQVENDQHKNDLKKNKEDSKKSKFENTKMATNDEAVQVSEISRHHIMNDNNFNWMSKCDSIRKKQIYAINIQNQFNHYPRKSLPISTKRIIFNRAQGQCEYRAPNGQRCHSHHQLEFDHIQSISHGGTNTIENLQLLCRHHNQYKVKETHGFIFQKRKNEII